MKAFLPLTKGTGMGRRGFCGLFLILFVAFGLHPAERDLAEYLPPDPEVRPWSARGGAQQYRERELFDYMDGGADIYIEFGFRRVLVQEYSREAHAIQLEIYRMEDDAAACGMYSIKKGDEGKQMAIGQEAFFSDSYLNFWAGSFLVTLVGMDTSEETLSGIQSIALAVSRRLPQTGIRPELLSFLPPAGRLDASLRYFRGNLGFRNSQHAVPPSSLKFSEGAMADYRSESDDRVEWSLCLLRFPTAALASEGFETLKGRFGSNPKFRTSAESGGLWVENREKGTNLFLVPIQNLLVLCDRLRKKEEISSIFSRQREIIDKSR